MNNSLAKIDGEAHTDFQVTLWIAVSLPPAAPQTTPTAGQTPERWFAEQVHAHDRSLKVWLRSSYPAIRDVDDIAQESYLLSPRLSINLSVNNVFNSPRVLLRCGSQTPDYARAYQRDEYGTRVAVGLKGTY